MTDQLVSDISQTYTGLLGKGGPTNDHLRRGKKTHSIEVRTPGEAGSKHDKETV